MVHKSEILTTYGYQIIHVTLHRSCNIKLSWIYHAWGEKNKNPLYSNFSASSMRGHLSYSCQGPHHIPWGYGSTARCPLISGFQDLLHAWSNPKAYLWPITHSPAEACGKLSRFLRVSWYKTSHLCTLRRAAHPAEHDNLRCEKGCWALLGRYQVLIPT